jgi:hypothetical protein
MKVHPYADEYWRDVAELFATTFGSRCKSIVGPTRRGFVRDVLEQWYDRHEMSTAWVAVSGGNITGFISAHVAQDGGGIITTPALAEDSRPAAPVLLETAEAFLRDQSVVHCRVMGLSKEYGVPFGGCLHTFLLNHGYWTRKPGGLEYVMEIDLTKVARSSAIDEYRRKNEREGYTFEFLREEHAASLQEFAPEWSLGGLSEPIASGSDRYPFAVCRRGDIVVGYCGTCHLPNKYGQAGWSFILLRDIELPECPYAGRGIGAVLLHMANKWLGEQGATFQTLVTGVGNLTQRLYRKAGYRYCFVQAKDIDKTLT